MKKTILILTILLILPFDVIEYIYECPEVEDHKFCTYNLWFNEKEAILVKWHGLNTTNKIDKVSFINIKETQYNNLLYKIYGGN